MLAGLVTGKQPLPILTPRLVSLAIMQLMLCRYAITLSVPKGSVRKGIYFDTASPHHAVRLIQGGDGRKDLLLVSGEEHDQGIKPEEFADYFGRLGPPSFAEQGRAVQCRVGQGQGCAGQGKAVQCSIVLFLFRTDYGKLIIKERPGGSALLEHVLLCVQLPRLLCGCCNQSVHAVLCMHLSASQGRSQGQRGFYPGI